MEARTAVKRLGRRAQVKEKEHNNKQEPNLTTARAFSNLVMFSCLVLVVIVVQKQIGTEIHQISKDHTGINRGTNQVSPQFEQLTHGIKNRRARCLVDFCNEWQIESKRHQTFDGVECLLRGAI